MRSAQLRAHLAANTELLRPRWRIGKLILERQDAEGWGAKVIDRLAADLRAAFPDQQGWTRRTLHYMRKLAERWPTEDAFVQHAAGQLPWTSVTTLLDDCNDRSAPSG